MYISWFPVVLISLIHPEQMNDKIYMIIKTIFWILPFLDAPLNVIFWYISVKIKIKLIKKKIQDQIEESQVKFSLVSDETEYGQNSEQIQSLLREQKSKMKTIKNDEIQNNNRYQSTTLEVI
ncbi:hypothetical protein PPERSA_08412 [Pseudocohnilembus persalinus]|uniref:Uncharacterized protein n=1 Tax=Pseudocohnilembus persalinus TaxID=266149 RepID=A0A0V0R6A7_PSEPJ|nr:hypothetical protein PPERSA_08412 [Pseudocohnilembus persalinus]|eukprot:KRX10009.1 hypothetical protein PPERSA_08412 [Pseudocohnilembus persalinus]